ncbi:hypothetical protein B0T26DRAFT_743298 [Lasiosphaeria miniovina]|uniref:Coiled-coil domain-containing protein 16 n=1 Tax=Lasiosphaeria miniovina TaxID=1954250 RepID=A0AA40DR15_9PEZI|nr:uncharacterized protein B0T26DRAFT_743298 [Lasiosphaeria miniovina]KAK0710107.1 hypothetical protein B0T26DRAFT_743298 [Lasiosphaeria miniovina]
MADVRALLRQQRAARRIEHPHAAYSDSGKLLCTLCHEHVKAESLWDTHIRGVGHQQRLQTLAHAAAATRNSKTSLLANGHQKQQQKQRQRQHDADEPLAAAADAPAAPSNKRKLDDDDDDDEEMGDDTAAADGAEAEDGVRKKRSKPDMVLSPEGMLTRRDSSGSGKPVTPPLGGRRQSMTPTLGVEIQIPSRPATPVALREGGISNNHNGSFGQHSANSSISSASAGQTTPKAVGRSPLIPQDETAGTAATPHRVPHARFIADTAPSSTAQHLAIVSTAAAATTTMVDEDEWAAFEADLVHGAAVAVAAAESKAAALRVLTDSHSDAVISAPVMTAAEVAAKSEEEERARRRTQAEAQVEDEREEAARAMESEFEVMEELEARARKLRERREALRLRLHQGGGGDAAAADDDAATGTKGSSAVTLDKENLAGGGAEQENGEDDDDDDDDDEDDWVGFRFHV